MSRVAARCCWSCSCAPRRPRPRRRWCSLGPFTTPTYAAAPASEPTRVFVTEKAGRVRLIVDGVVQATPFLDLTAITRANESERGLLSIAFAPDYATSGQLLRLPDRARARSARSRSGSSRARRRTRTSPTRRGRLLIGIPHTQASNHNGGTVQVGPGRQGLARDGRRRRLEQPVRQRAEPGLAARQAAAARPGRRPSSVEQLAQGLRNPFRFSFAPDGTIVIADVGQGLWEEINVGLAANYGWPCREGAHAYRTDPGCTGVPLADPVVEKSHSPGRLLRDRRRPRRPRPRPADAGRPLHLRRQLQPGAALGEPLGAGAATPRRASPSPAWRVRRGRLRPRAHRLARRPVSRSWTARRRRATW